METVICWECGKKLKEAERKYQDTILHDFRRCYCESCFNKLQEEQENDLKQYIMLKKKVMYNRAVRKLELQNIEMYDYKEAIEVVHDKVLSDPDKFDSSYEVIAAIILVQNRIYSKMQYKIGKYQVDFLLPDIGVVLEIDGDRHKHKQVYDNNRDINIRNALGPGWDIVRIKTSYLDQKAIKLPEAINKVIEYRQNYNNKFEV